MPLFLIQHAFQGGSGQPRDRYVNTFHVEGPSIGVGFPEGPPLAGHIKTFYDGLNVGAGGSSGMFSKYVNNVGRSIKIYDLGDPKPRTPIYEETSPAPPFPSSTRASMPLEVAVCLSYSALKVSGTAAARRRGRIYLGPWSEMILEEGAGPTNGPVVATDYRQKIIDGALGLHLNLTLMSYSWVVYSPSNDSAADITSFYVDDAFDTQRRRGIAPITRTVSPAIG